MKIGDAIEALINGQIVKRQAWQGMALIYTPPAKAELPEGHHYRQAVDDDAIILGGHIDMILPNSVVQPGWIPSVSDLVADDWVVTEEVSRQEADNEQAGAE